MFGECHAHIIMDGNNYKEAISLHKEAVNEEANPKNFKAYQEQGITFVAGDGRETPLVFPEEPKCWRKNTESITAPLFLPSTKTGTYGSIVGKALII